MMNIISTVGTSLITNSSVDCEVLADQVFSHEYFDENSNFYKSHISSREAALLQYLKNGNTCAELAAVKKISKDEPALVQLLCTETTLSYMCGRVLKKFIGENTTIEVVEGLQVKDAKEFQSKGFLNLIEKVKELNSSNAKTVLNISGGYKALIPPLTLLAQLERIPLYYIFEDSDELIETGTLPISFDWEVIESYSVYLNEKGKRENAPDDIKDELRKLKILQEESNDLTILGKLVAAYSYRSSPFTATIFGYLIEHKFFEAYNASNQYHKVHLSVNVKGSEDIDLLIQPDENNTFIGVEIKPFAYLADQDKVFKIIQAFKKRLDHETIKTKFGRPSEIWLLMYSYVETEPSQVILDGTSLEMSKKIDEEMKATFQDCVFKVKHYFIKRNKLGGGERHIYQSFMKKSIKMAEIIDIYPTKNS